MAIDFLLGAALKKNDRDAIVWRDATYSYEWLSERVERWGRTIEEKALPRCSVVALEADFSPNSVALFLALLEHSCVVVPLMPSVADRRQELLDIAEVEAIYHIAEDDAVSYETLDRTAHHELYQELRQRGHPGLVLFSSGSTGKSKASVHDMVPLLDKYRIPRRRLRTITFLLYDHIGGVNTMLYTLANEGCMVTIETRNPDAVLSAVERHRVELLPTTPTFMNLMLLSEAHERYDLTSLKTVTYGTEPMPESTLKRFHELFPNIRLLQTYGLSEVGILRSKSRSSDSLWVKIGGAEFQTRVVDGVLQIKAKSAMLGYLNAPNPFTKDGWFITGDSVEVDGEYIKILGRKCELINVAGQKVYPAEVENVISQMQNVADVLVYGEPNPIVGQIVAAKVALREHEPLQAFRVRLKKFCRERLQAYKVPGRVVLSDNSFHSARFKKERYSPQKSIAESRSGT